MKNITNNLFAIFSLSLVCCDRTNNTRVIEEKMNYTDFVAGKFGGVTAEKVKSMLGEPSSVKQAKGSDVWDYGPNIEEMINGEDGAIIGVTVYFDEQGKVREITSTRKTK